MAKEKTEQRHLIHRGRQFHFVSYEGRPGNAARMVAPTGRAWFLMSAGKRWEVMPEEPGMPDEEVERLLTEWLESNVF